MSSDPSPFIRLLRLEQAMEQLLAATVPEARLPTTVQAPAATRPIWPADELLLTRLLRRTPEALRAYFASAELTATERQGLRLHPSATISNYEFCELIDGDATVSLASHPPSWIWTSETFLRLFNCPSGHDNPDQLVIEALPLFKPVSRGKSWTLYRRGELGLQARSFPEQAEQAMLLRRLETLERHVSQHTLKLEAEIKDLRIQLSVQQNQIERLLRLSALDPSRPA